MEQFAASFELKLISALSMYACMCVCVCVSTVYAWYVQRAFYCVRLTPGSNCLRFFVFPQRHECLHFIGSQVRVVL